MELVERVETALDGIDSDPAALEAVQAIVELYGEGLRRMMEGAREEDDLVAHLLLMHDLHPVPLEQRVRDALRLHGEAVELLSVDGGVVRLRMNGGCGSSTATVKSAVADAAPDAEEIVVLEQAEAKVLTLPMAGAA